MLSHRLWDCLSRHETLSNNSLGYKFFLTSWRKEARNSCVDRGKPFIRNFTKTQPVNILMSLNNIESRKVVESVCWHKQLSSGCHALNPNVDLA